MAIYFAQSVALVPSLQARGKGQAAPFVIKLKARGKFNRYFTCKKNIRNILEDSGPCFC